MVTITSPSRNTSFVRHSIETPLEGQEGKQLKDKIYQVTYKIKKDEPIQRLLESYEKGNQQRHQELLDYIDSLRSEVLVSGETDFTVSVLEKALHVWEGLRAVFSSKNKCLEVPDAVKGDRDNFMYVWSRGKQHLECEIFGNGEVEFFYRGNNDEIWGEDIKVGQEFSATIIEKVALFTW